MVIIMTKKEKGALIVERLKEKYPGTCSLDWRKDYELLFSTRLAAQCTDARVNVVAKVLYEKYDSLEKLANADYEELCEIIRPCGLFRTKAQDLISASQMLLSDYGGKVPDSMEELLKLPGIGRKTANLVLSDIFGQPAVVADTHCIRISNRLGLCNSKDPFKVEQQLSKLIEPSEQAPLCHRFVHFGRDVCTARSPKCFACHLTELCAEYASLQKKGKGAKSTD